MSILLGTPGDYTSTAPGEVDAYCTKVGGSVVWPEGLQESQPDAATVPSCEKCKQPLALLFQAYTPLSLPALGRALPHRHLLVFACPRVQCTTHPRSWRALRLQHEPSDAAVAAAETRRETEEEAAGALLSSGYDAVPSSSTGDDWGLGGGTLGGDDWGLGGDGNWGDLAAKQDDGSAALDLADLGRALEEASAAKRSAPASAASQHASTSQSVEAFPSRSSILTGQCFPEFHVLAEPEPERSQGRKKKGRGTEDPEDAHIRQLIAQYELEEGEISMGGGASTSQVPLKQQPTAADVPAPPADLEEDEALKATWQGEGYEEDSARWASTQYIKFQQRLERLPRQVARYGFGSDLLWPDPEVPTVPPCAHCGAARVVELQLMAPLSAALEEAHEYLREGEGVETLPVPDTWDWSTVAVWTCGRSCGPAKAGGWLVAEEALAVSKE